MKNWSKAVVFALVFTAILILFRSASGQSGGFSAPSNRGPVATVVDTTATVAVGGGFSELHVNENATAAQAVVYNLPTASPGVQKCFANGNNGSAANTGTLELLTSGTGQFIIYTDGTLSASGGDVTSGGAAGDAACLWGVDATHWIFYVQRGTWPKN